MQKKNIAIILAAGRGSRFPSKTPKQYQNLGKENILRITIQRFLQSDLLDGVMVVINKNDILMYEASIKGLPNILPYVVGGENRQESSKIAVMEVAKYKPEFILIHDAARPFVTASLIKNVILEGENAECVFPAIKINDTIRDEYSDGVFFLSSRDKKYRVQTPQLLKFSTAYDLYKKTDKLNSFTDDAELFIQSGKKVKLVEGDERNIKITTAKDMLFAEDLMSMEYENRVGIGFDAHKFSDNIYEDNYIILGGVKIPYTKRIEAHSDGDVLLHAIVDALLGAASLGDIGDYFSPSDEKWKNADSSLFLSFACKKLEDMDSKILNIDVVVICQEPKITPYKMDIRNNIAKIMKIDHSRVSVKATTTEKMGFTGRKEGIAVQAIANIIMRGKL